MKHAVVSSVFRGGALTLGSERTNRMALKQQLGVLTVEFTPVALSDIDLEGHNRQRPAPS
jgi:hypothetical protein